MAALTCSAVCSPAGNSSYLQRSSESLYTKTATTDLKLGWYIGSGYACSASLRAICEIPEGAYACPVTTPPQAALAPADSICEQPAPALQLLMLLVVCVAAACLGH